MLNIILKLLCILTLIGAITNCSMFHSYSSNSQNLLQTYQSKNLIRRTPDKKDTLANMQQGLIERDLTDYEQSNNYLNVALDNSNAWLMSFKNSTAGKLSDEITTSILNDNVLDYHVKDYEATMITTFMALNYMDLDNIDNARVAIKQTYQLEQDIQDKNYKLYSLDQNNLTLEKQAMQRIERDSPPDAKLIKSKRLKNSYQNAFSHYLAGFIFEQRQEPSLARPGYLKALELNPQSTLARKAIARIDNNIKPKDHRTELLIVEEVGHAPQYKSRSIHLPFNANLYGKNATCINTINIFYPTLRYDSSANRIYNYSLDERYRHPELISDIDLMSARNLKDNLPHIIRRNISANIRNIVVSQSLCKAGGNLGGILSIASSIGSTFIDKADERTWSLLPSKFYIDRLDLPYGEHKLSINVNGQTITKSINLNKPYQVVTLRIIQGQVFFSGA